MEPNEESSGTGVLRQLLLTIAFIVGALGNVTALWILYRSARARNRKHVLMLRCLATNDLIALCGMLILMNLHKYQVIPLQWRCILYVGLRAFGIGSGCVALVMAVERWLALTRPFLYQAWVTHRVIKRTIFMLWFFSMILTYLPLFGFGLFHDNGQCKRYRDATVLKDQVYAYIFLVFGTTLCLCIAYCNLSIICELWKIGSSKKILVRRCSRASMHNKYCTTEELAFAKLMAAICIIFLLCWMPQMISIPLAQFYPDARLSRIFSKIADFLMCIYFCLDPYVYVLQRYMTKGYCKLPWNRTSSSTNPDSISNTPTSILIHHIGKNKEPEPK